MSAMRLTRMIQAVDAHAAGEPGRVIVGGVLDVPGATMLEKMRHVEAHGDGLRRCMLREPRGYPGANCNLVLPPTRPDADAGFVIMEHVEYPGMSGTNTICTATVLLETGVVPMREPVTELTLEAPAGLIRVRAECASGKVKSVTFRNVPAFAVYLDREIEVPRHGYMRADGHAARARPAPPERGLPPRRHSRHGLHGPARRRDNGRPVSGSRADAERPGVDHRVRELRRRPRRSVPRGIHRGGHLVMIDRDDACAQARARVSVDQV